MYHYHGLKSDENVSNSIFLYLQLLDFITTLMGFRLGAAEASPFVAKLLRISSPFVGVAASKLFALFIGGLVHPSLAHCELD
jgi:hypothetical protein